MTLGVLENLAMLPYPRCDDFGHHSWKHPVMPFSSRYSTPVFLTQESLCSLRVDIVASSFRILVTFALVLEVRGSSFFQILRTAYGRSSLNQKITTRVLLMSSPFCIVNLPVLPFCMDHLEEICGTCWHTKSMHPQLRKPYVPLSCLSLVVFWPLSINWQSGLVVHLCYRCVLSLWSVKPFYFRMTRRNKLQNLVHI